MDQVLNDDLEPLESLLRGETPEPPTHDQAHDLLVCPVELVGGDAHSLGGQVPVDVHDRLRGHTLEDVPREVSSHTFEKDRRFRMADTGFQVLQEGLRGLIQNPFTTVILLKIFNLTVPMHDVNSLYALLLAQLDHHLAELAGCGHQYHGLSSVLLREIEHGRDCEGVHVGVRCVFKVEGVGEFHQVLRLLKGIVLPGSPNEGYFFT